MPWRADGVPGDPGLVTCGRVREWLDPFLDGDLARPEEEALEAHLPDCPDCRAELAMARRLREAVREGLPLLTCPPEVTTEVMARVAREAADAPPAGPARRLAGRLPTWLGGGALRPALVAAALLLLVLAAPLLYRSVVPSGSEEPAGVAEAPSAPYSPEEVAEAEEQARLVLAYVGSVGREAARAVQEDVLEAGIGRPAQRLVEGLQAAGLAPAGEETGGREEP